MSAPLCKAVIVHDFGGPEVLQVGEKEIPLPSDGQVQVQVSYAGVNPSDTYMRLGPNGPWAATPHLLPSLPFTPGNDAAGVISAVGEGVDSFKVGDRVYVQCGTGATAEFAVCQADKVHPLPENISFAEGACIGVPCATAYRAILQRGGATRDEAVFIHGSSGAVGLAAVQIAISRGNSPSL